MALDKWMHRIVCLGASCHGFLVKLVRVLRAGTHTGDDLRQMPGRTYSPREVELTAQSGKAFHIHNPFRKKQAVVSS